MSEIYSPRPAAPLPGQGTAAPSAAPAAVREAPAGLRAAQPGTILEATVLGRDSAGHLMLRTDRGLLVLAIKTNPPTGARVTLQLRPAGAQMQAYILSVRAPADGARPAGTPIVPTTPTPLDTAPAAAATPTQPVAAKPVLTRDWPALQAALQALERPGGDDADKPLAVSNGNPLGQAVPRPGPALANGLLFLMVALKGGKIGRWLDGEPLRALERGGRSDLVRGLRSDFQQLARLAQDAGDDWRLFALPVLADGAAHPVRLFLRRHDEDADPTADAAAPARFVVELTLSQLGDLQLDGLARPDWVETILRSRAPLPAALEAHLNGAFTDTLAASGAAGRLTFHAADDWHFLPVPNADEHTGLTA